MAAPRKIKHFRFLIRVLLFELFIKLACTARLSTSFTCLHFPLAYRISSERIKFPSWKNQKLETEKGSKGSRVSFTISRLLLPSLLSLTGFNSFTKMQKYLNRKAACVNYYNIKILFTIFTINKYLLYKGQSLTLCKCKNSLSQSENIANISRFLESAIYVT